MNFFLFWFASTFPTLPLKPVVTNKAPFHKSIQVSDVRMQTKAINSHPG